MLTNMNSEIKNHDTDNTVEIVEAEPEMLDDIVAIEKASFTVCWSKNSFAQAIETENFSLYVLMHCGIICGFYCLMTVGGESELLNIAVLSDYRGLGFGSVLLSHAVENALSDKSGVIYLEVRRSNAPARGLYRKFGFEELGVRRNYYSHPTEDAVIMRKILSVGGIG